MRQSRELRNTWAVALILTASVVLGLVSSAAAVPCPEVVFARVGDKSAAIGWTLGVEESEIDDFGGYRVWMREVWKHPGEGIESFTLVREYVYGETNPAAAGYWPFGPYYEEPVRADSAMMFQNAFPYEFAVSAFSESDPNTVNYDCIEATRTGVIYPRFGVENDLKSVKCIPNPYRDSADWEYGGNRRVAFVGLPERATIRIYTVAADLVRVLEHDDPESDQEFWNLKNDDGDEVAPGVYIYQVVQRDPRSPGTILNTIESKVMIIK
jgi:hypothetical protein